MKQRWLGTALIVVMSACGKSPSTRDREPEVSDPPRAETASREESAESPPDRDLDAAPPTALEREVERLHGEAEAKREKISRLQLERDGGSMYHLEWSPAKDEVRVMQRGLVGPGRPARPSALITTVKTRYDSAWVYQIDEDGDLSRVPGEAWERFSAAYERLLNSGAE